MAITHATTTRDALADLIDTLINTGSGTSNFTFRNAQSVTLAVVDLDNPAFGSSSSGAISLAGTPQEGTASHATSNAVCTAFDIKDRNGVAVLSGTVAATGADINVSNTTINNGDTCRISSFTYSAAP
jgi:hypothetical protein